MGDEPIKEIGQRGSQFQTDFTQLFESAPASNELMKEQGAAVAEAFREQFPELFEGVEFSGGPIKEWDRALLKLLDESTGQLDPAKGQNVVDLVRGRIVIDTADQVRAIREVLADPDTRAALGIEYVKDRFAEPSGSHYRDINIAIRLPDGHLAEIQINQRDMLAASEFTHDAYEDIDAIQTRAKLENRDLTPAEVDEIRDLSRFTRDAHNYGAARFEGAEELLNSNGRAKLEKAFAARVKADPDFVPGQTLQDGHKYDFVIRDGELPLEISRDAHGGPGYKSIRNETGIRPNSITAAADNIDVSGIEIAPRELARRAADPPVSYTLLDAAPAVRMDSAPAFPRLGIDAFMGAQLGVDRNAGPGVSAAAGSDLERMLDQRLADPRFTHSFGQVTPRQMQAVREGLLEMPPAALRDFLNSEFKLVLGTRDSLSTALSNAGLDPSGANSLGMVSPRNNPLAHLVGNNPSLMIRVDQSIDEIKGVARHETGHAIDHINMNYRGYGADNPNFERAVQQYLDAKENAPRTMLLFDGDRGFRHDHAPLYDRSQYARELVAEMYKKYSIVAAQNNPAVAEQFMSRNYPYAWDSMKRDVMPQIEESLRMQGLDAQGRAPQPETPAPKPSLADMDSGTRQAILQGDWKSATTGDGVRIVRLAVGEMSPEQVQALETVLKEQGLSPIRHRSDTLGDTIRLAERDLGAFRKLQVDLTNTPERPRVAVPRPDTDTFRAMAASDIQATLGQDNVKRFGFHRNGDITIDVPNDFSRQELARLGVTDVDRLQRIPVDGGQNHRIRIPKAQLPGNLLEEGLSEVNLTSRLQAQLGAENIRNVQVTPDGRVLLTVPDTYSRGNLAAIGIENPSSLARPAHLHANGMAVIEIPHDRMPPAFKPEIPTSMFAGMEVERVPVAATYDLSTPSMRDAVNAGAELVEDAAGMGKVGIGAATGQFLGRHSMSFVGGGAAAFSVHQAFAESDQGEHTVAIRGSAAALDVVTVVDDAIFNSAGTQRVVNAAGIKVGAAGASTIAGGVAIVATTSAEIAVAVSNKDGNAAGTAAVIGTASLTGMAVGAGVGSVVPVVGTAVGAGGGAVVGAGVGIATTTYSAADEWTGRQFNSAIYHGSIFNDGIIATTTENLEKIQEFRDRLANGEQLSQEDVREMQELMEEMRDDMMDLRKAEVGQAQAFATTGDERDAEYLRLNRELQTQIQETLEAVDQEFDQAQQSRLDQIMGGATSAAELMAHLDNNSEALALIQDAEHETQWFTFSDHEDWQERVDEVAAAVTNPATGEVAFTHLTEDERLEQQRELHNVRENVEERINNLLVQARDNSMSEAEYQELVALKATLDQIDTLEAGFIAGSTPLGEQVFSANEQTLRDDARSLVDGATSARDLMAIMARDENFDVVRGNDSISQWSWFGNNHDGWKDDVEEIAEKDLTSLDDDDLLSEYQDLEEVEEEVNDRIYNLMQQARDGELSRSEFRELQDNYALLDQIEAEKARFNDEYVSRLEPEQPQDTAAYTAPEVLPESGLMANGFNECAFCPMDPILLTDLQMDGDVTVLGDNGLIQDLVDMGLAPDSVILNDTYTDLGLADKRDMTMMQPT